MAKLKAQEVNVTVYDDAGNDVTPVSLYTSFKNTVNKANPAAVEGSVMASVAKETAADVLNVMESVSGSWGGSAFKSGGLSQSNSSRASKSSASDTDEDESVASLDETIEDKEDLIGETGTSSHKAKNTEIDPNKIFHLRLTETDTITLLDLHSLSVSNEATDEVSSVRTANARYKEVFFTKILISFSSKL
jgi:hypothetical protein